MEHYNVLIATPGRSAEMEYVKSLVQTINVLNKKNITYRFLSRYSPYIFDARESTLTDIDFDGSEINKPLLGKVSYDKIFFIDADISWTPEDFLKLYHSRSHIVTGLYMTINRQYQHHPEYIDKLNNKSLIEIDDCGFGFIAIKHGVFEKMNRPWFMPFLEQDENHKVIISEDIFWCRAAKKNGFKIFLDPTVRVAHHKIIPIYPED